MLLCLGSSGRHIRTTSFTMDLKLPYCRALLGATNINLRTLPGFGNRSGNLLGTRDHHPMHRIKIYNWNVPYENGSCGFLLYNIKSKSIYLPKY